MHRSPALALALVWLATPSWPVAHFRPADWTPFETSRHGEIVVPAMVNGAGPFRFLIDTGSSHSAISEEVARAARAPPVARTVVTSPIGEDLRLVVRIERLEIGPLSASGVLASVIRPNGIDTARGIQGLIGQDVLAAHRYTIDLRKHGIVWHADRPGPSSRQSTFELRLTEGRFLVELPQATSVLHLVPDSGTAAIVLFERPNRFLPAMTPVPFLAELATLTDRSQVRHVRVQALRIGATTLRNVPAVLVPGPDSDGSAGDGLLPLHLFDRVTFDGPARVLTVWHMAWTVVDSSSHIWGLAVDANARPRSGEAARLTEGSGPHYGSPAPSTDGRLAFTGSRHGSGANLFLLEGAAPRQITTDSSSHSGPHWTPGGRDIAFVVDHGEGPGFWVVDPETGRERLLFPLSALHPPASTQPSPAAPAANIAIAPDFTRLAMSIVKDGTPNIWVAPLRDSRPDGPLVQRTFEQAGGSYPVWSPDGRSIAYQCSEGPDTHVCVTGADGAGRAQLTHEAGQSWIGGWTRDGDKILFAARRDGLWNVALVSRTSSEVRTLTHFSEPRTYVRYPRLDPFHSRVVFERSDATGRIWAVELPVADGRR